VFLLRRAAAYQAYYEHLPLRRTSVPHGPDMRIYRRLRFGDLLDLHLLDTRQYRTDQPVDRSTPHASAAADRDFRPDLPPGGNPSGTLLGQVQEQWLLDGLRQSPTRWNALGNQVTMARFDNGPYQPATRGGPHDFNMDAWDGYGAERQRILDTIGARPDLGVVVLTGDVHGAFVHDLEADFTHPGEPVATEFIGTSITSGYPPVDWVATERAAREASPWTHYVGVRRRGYATCTVTPDAWRTDFHTVDSTADQGLVVAKDAALRTDASFVVEHGRAGAQPA
jgi:alkaline phosphatase D